MDALGDLGPVAVAWPVRARDGDWVHQGWESWEPLASRTDPTRWDAAIDAGDAFHAALASVPQPALLDRRDDPWARADRLSWDLECRSDHQALASLLAMRRPVGAAMQLVHGDLLGNILYAPGRPPVLIDWSPYWRPPAWASAVAAVDAVCWHGAPAALLERRAEGADWPQVLVRALIFRIATDREVAPDPHTWRPHPACRPVADAVARLVE